MNSFNHILVKLEVFSKKYYTKVLLGGVLLFLAFGVLLLIAVLSVEYWLWLSSTGRLLLFLLGLALEAYLLFRYIVRPLFYLLKLKKGITNKEASVLIGKHFPEVGDKLLNLLDLSEDANQSELLLASIKQRSDNLSTIAFTKAVDFKENLKYLRYLVIPALLILVIWSSGNINEFFSSFNRVVNYDVAYEPPAPFSFKLITTDLEVLDSESVTIQVITEGKVRPQDIAIVVEGKSYALQQTKGVYQYTFTPPLRTTQFYFAANDVVSRQYELQALKTPVIQNFEMVLEYPPYTKRGKELIKSTGNAVVLEGTKISVDILAKDADTIAFSSNDSVVSFTKNNDRFKFVTTVFSDMDYQISTSNLSVQEYEKLSYRFQVIKDASPSIKVEQVLDSLNLNTSYYVGIAADDYAVSHIRVVCFADEQPNDKQVVTLHRPNLNFKQFYYTFPTGLKLDSGKSYSFYFEAIDNDAINGGKVSRSDSFSAALLDKNQLKNSVLDKQQAIIKNVDKSLVKFKEQKENLKELSKNQKEKGKLNFNDYSQVKEYLQKQEQQEQLMQKFTRQLKDNLEKSESDNLANKLLKERLERQELKARKNQKLLNELNKIADKINKEELTKRLDEIAKKQQSSERNLEQLVELTKAYYVREKASQLAKDLEHIAEEQQKLAEKDLEDTISKLDQENLNKKFDQLTKDLEELIKDNKSLKRPLELSSNKAKEDSVKEDQEKALEEIEKHEQADKLGKESQKQTSAKDAKNRQRSAAQKLKEMSQSLQKSASAAGGSTVTEDASMLRQILDNLVTFSFKQESLYEELGSAKQNYTEYATSIRQQQELRKLFEHIDDSLFSLSLRRAELSEFVNEQIAEVYYNNDKALEAIAENQIYQGVGYQKYVLTASNSLSDFLANILENMQQSMQAGEGEGEQGGFQLPTIIKSQQELKDRLNGKGGGKSKPENGEQGNGQKGKQGEGEGSGNGQKGKQGEGEGSGKGNRQGKKEGSGSGNNGGKSDGNGGIGKDGNKSGGSEGLGEQELKEIYEIYKEQQQIRNTLEKQLANMINADDRNLAEKLIRQMEEFENELIENGITNRSKSKLNTITYELIKLKDAALKQGKMSERESTTNMQTYDAPNTDRPASLEKYQIHTEILNYQALPLQPGYQNKVKEYFENND